MMTSFEIFNNRILPLDNYRMKRKKNLFSNNGKIGCGKNDNVRIFLVQNWTE